MNPQDCPVTELIPQRPPMVMIDRLVAAGDITATGELVVKETNLFVHKGYFQEAGLVEFIAQTAAAHKGYLGLHAREPVKEGYIGAVKNLVVHLLPPVHTLLHAHIKIENEIVGYTIIMGSVRMKDLLVAECEIRILTET